MADTIIVGVTDAAASRRALDWAARRARDLGRRIVLFSVVGGAVGAVGEDDIVAQVVDATAARLQAVAAELAASGLDVAAEVANGDPVALLVAASSDAELLVIGGEPRGRGHRGQHGARIAAGAHCPVVVVPEPGDAPRRGVVVGVDGSETSSAAIAFAATEAERLGEPLTVLAAWLPVAVPGDFGVYPDVYLTDLEGITRAGAERVAAEVTERHPGLEVLTDVSEGDPAQVIGDSAESASLVVVGSHGRSGFARFLLGSVSEEVVAHLAAPTAVVR
ncbi:universal stress protein [Microbacterium sp. SORGH_AS_0888]|uniref:universal stress protein n=1 Tax=Microbacterium sp. SORGH_AS_0888 TaxID=3041791 RepID=UPI002784A572|nr:universal stress protein [Microbacterium sp. SORGH_AS_0888]MDQ1130385.1 nucleotide-binding universal stress UspA family protein [Microbacterium sp. SORGH_AS_0888]